MGVGSDWLAVETRLFDRVGGDPICELGPIPPFLVLDSPRVDATAQLGGKRRFIGRSHLGGCFRDVDSRGNGGAANQGEIGFVVARVPRFVEATGVGDASSPDGADCGIPQIGLFRMCEIGMELGLCGKRGGICDMCDGPVSDWL